MMEVAEILQAKPGINADNDPAMFLCGVNYLDPEDPIDSFLVAYKKEIDTESFPTAAEQRALIAGARGGDLQELADTHMGMIAAVAYPFKGTRESYDLLLEGRKALINAAMTYGREEHGDFSDYAVSTIHSAFSSILPDLAGDSFVELAERPMEGVYQFVETLEVVDEGSVAAAKRLEKQNEERKYRGLSPREIQTLNLLNLSEAEIASVMELSIARVQNITSSLRTKFGVGKRREELALAALNWGAKFEIREIPPIEEYTIRERQVALRLAKKNADIAGELSIEEWQVHRAITALNRKTDAGSRAELLLMAHMNGFEPTEEELNPPPDPLEGFTPREREIIPLIARSRNKEIAEQFEMPSATTANHAVATILEKAGVSSRVDFVLKMHKMGVKFEIITPEEPITSVLSPDEIEMARHLQVTNEEIATAVDKSIHQVDYFMQTVGGKLGTRTRQELALVVEMYAGKPENSGEKLDVPRWRLVKRLGLHALNGYSMQDLLSVATGNEQEIIHAYYLSGEQITWEAVGKKLGIKAGKARRIATGGVKKIREHLNGAA